MQVVCAWCEMFIGVKSPIRDGSVSHSICGNCYENFMSEIRIIEKKEGRTYGDDSIARDEFNLGS
ncbi:MAG TPA: hypothetical protein VLB01_07660 [Thermodesulfobacteriota bacterium]|nr:hypothetical protein [Thermodesulfobacteriota bacterium]